MPQSTRSHYTFDEAAYLRRRRIQHRRDALIGIVCGSVVLFAVALVVILLRGPRG